MYNKIPFEIKPTEASAKITYTSDFEPYLCLMLRERRATSLAHMQDGALEVESNVLVVDRLRNKTDRDRGRGISEASTSCSFLPRPQVDELIKMVKSLSIEMKNMKFEGKKGYKDAPNVDNRGNFTRPINIPQILPRELRSRDRDGQKFQTPLQNNLVVDEEREEEEIDPEIHCLGDNSPFPHLTQSTYEEFLMDSQINELCKGEKTNGSSNKYNLSSRKKEVKYNISYHPSRAEKPAKDATNNNKEEKTQNPPIVAKGLVTKVKEIINPPSYLNFEHEIQNIRIHVPLLELVNHEDFKKSLSNILLSNPSCHSTDSVNLQYENLAVIIGPLIEDKDDSSPPFYTYLNIHDKVLHNFLMDSRASHNLMSKTVMDKLGL
jgi:hypothetical protein